jgi:hypothetical protein
MGMNRFNLESNRRANLNKLALVSRKNVDRIAFGAESPEHKIAKMLCYLLIKDGVEPIRLPELVNAESIQIPIQTLALAKALDYTQEFEHEWEVPVIVTEAMFANLKRKADLLVLDTFIATEIETDPTVIKKESIMVYIDTKVKK